MAFPSFSDEYSKSALKHLRDGKRHIIIYGMTKQATWCFNYLRGQNITIRYFCTENPVHWGSKFLDRRILSPYDLKQYVGECEIIVAGEDHMHVARTLDYLGLEVPLLSHPHYAPHVVDGMLANLDRVKAAYDLFEDNYSRYVFVELLRCRMTLQGQRYQSLRTEPKYFPKDIFDFSDREIFVDGGAHNGETILHFLQAMNEEFDTIHAFEPDPRCDGPIHRRPLTKKQFAKITINHVGLGEVDTERRIKLADSVHTGTSVFDESGDSTIAIRSLDSYLNGERITMFKLDVEKHERQALRGAIKTLQTHRPKLAICVYHLHDDQWEIPLLLKEMVPEYRFWLRHHSSADNETVLYARV